MAWSCASSAASDCGFSWTEAPVPTPFPPPLSLGFALRWGTSAHAELRARWTVFSTYELLKPQSVA